jgi:geranylgeranyl pyrophosphate synthase
MNDQERWDLEWLKQRHSELQQEMSELAGRLKLLETKQDTAQPTTPAGSLQLVAGQVADLEGEGKKLSVAELRYIHERKTSALLCCSVRLVGALSRSTLHGNAGNF